MALSRTDHTPAVAATVQSAFTTGSFTFPNGHLVVVVGLFMNESGSEAPANLFSIDDTGADLVWTKQVVGGNSATDYAVGASIWTATGNGTPCTLTITKSGTQVFTWYVAPFTYTGQHASPIGTSVGNQLSVADGAASLTLGASPASSSHVIAAAAAAVGGGSVNITHGTGWTEIYDSPSAENTSRQIQTRTGSTSTTVGWDDVAVGGSGNYHNPVGVALEIIAADAGGAASPRQNLLLLGVG